MLRSLASRTWFDEARGGRGGRRFHFVPRSKIERIGLGHGFLSERALPLALVSALLVLVGLYFMFEGSSFQFEGSSFQFGSSRQTKGWAAFSFGPRTMGLVMLFHALKRGLYLRLLGPAGETRLRVGKIEVTQAAHTLQQATFTLGYQADLGTAGLPG